MELKKPPPKLNRSLTRGLDILRCFKPGVDLLGNGEIAERTKLPPSTVSRLTQTLVLSGFLERSEQHSAYRLAPAVLSLGHAYKVGSQELKLVAPLMRKASEKYKLNVGLAIADRMEMVYLESIRYTKNVALRTVVAGQRVPIERTSLGMAWIATLDSDKRSQFIAEIKRQKLKNWIQIEKEIYAAIESINKNNYCVASWLPEIFAISTTLTLLNGQKASLNFSTPSDSNLNTVLENYTPHLLELKDMIESAFQSTLKAT
jgi:DNA-binding IclR family transcriptional regulator